MSQHAAVRLIWQQGLIHEESTDKSAGARYEAVACVIDCNATAMIRLIGHSRFKSIPLFDCQKNQFSITPDTKVSDRRS